MTVLEAIILGIVQGLGEFLPISSSGHLVLAQNMLGMQEPSLLMTVLLHVGTLAAVLVVFWRDWWAMLKNPFKSNAFWMLVLATLPAVAVALLFGDAIDLFFADRTMHWYLGFFFLFTAVLLVAAESFTRQPTRGGRHSRKQVVDDVKPAQALTMGTMQAVAVLPGVSRSGSTIVGGILSGLDRSVAAKFSFMMSVPAILGSLVFEARDLLSGGTDAALSGGWLAPVIGVIVAAVCGWAAIRWMLALIQKASLKWFALYVGVLGLLVLADHFFFHLFIA